MSKTINISRIIDQRVSEVLFYVWDPIGININVTCRDEYDSYVTIISAYLLSNVDENGLNCLLLYIMEQLMGLKLLKNHRRKYQHQQAIQALVNWRDLFVAKYPNNMKIKPMFPFNEDFATQLIWSREQSYNREF